MEYLEKKEMLRLKYQGINIRQNRKINKLSQAQLASMLNVSTTAVQNWERGANDVQSKYKSDLYDAIKLDLEAMNAFFRDTVSSKGLEWIEKDIDKLDRVPEKKSPVIVTLDNDVYAQIRKQSEDSLKNINDIINASLAEQYVKELITEKKNYSAKNAEVYKKAESWDSSTPLRDDEVEVPYYMDVELAAGVGAEMAQEYKGPVLRFGKSFLKRNNAEENTTVCVKVMGNSMEPRLHDGDVVAVNTTETDIKDGNIYAINHGGLLRIKRLYRLPNQGVRINSFNSDEHPDEYIHEAYQETIKIVGRVFWGSITF